MYALSGIQDDLVTGVKRWQDPVALAKSYAEIPSQPIGVIAGIVLPLLGLVLLLGKRRRR